MIKISVLVALLAGVISPVSNAQFQFLGDKTAISLSYDDALVSQLENAVPALNSHGFKASFYIIPTSQAIKTRLDDFKVLAKQGHELGNHSLFHPCSGFKPHREWVTTEQNLDHYTPERAIREVLMANMFLQAIDGQTQRTFTPPCFDTQAENKDFIDPLKAHFIAIKGVGNDNGQSVLWAPVGVSGPQLINYVKGVPQGVRLINILFHGIGGDHLSVSTHAHSQLLAYLAANKEHYYVDSYINIMKKAAHN